MKKYIKKKKHHRASQILERVRAHAYLPGNVLICTQRRGKKIAVVK